MADSALYAEKVHIYILDEGFSLDVKTLQLRILNSKVGFSLNVHCPPDSTSLSASADRSVTLSSNDASYLENNLSNARYLSFGDFEYQTVVGVGRPIEFLGKASVGAQTKWTTIQKESYAIFYCCETVHSLISDRKLTILRDH